jgi:hypothetical protein
LEFGFLTQGAFTFVAGTVTAAASAAAIGDLKIQIAREPCRGSAGARLLRRTVQPQYPRIAERALKGRVVDAAGTSEAGIARRQSPQNVQAGVARHTRPEAPLAFGILHQRRAADEAERAAADGSKRAAPGTKRDACKRRRKGNRRAQMRDEARERIDERR